MHFIQARSLHQPAPVSPGFKLHLFCKEPPGSKHSLVPEASPRACPPLPALARVLKSPSTSCSHSAVQTASVSLFQEASLYQVWAHRHGEEEEERLPFVLKPLRSHRHQGRRGLASPSAPNPVPRTLTLVPPNLGAYTSPPASLWVTRAPLKGLRGRGRHAVTWDPDVPL